VSRQRTPQRGRSAPPPARGPAARAPQPAASAATANSAPDEVEDLPEDGDEVVAGRPWRPIALGAICLAGIGISIYLLIVHYQPSALICSNSGAIDCSAVLKSPQSVIFGIPVPIFGLLYFVAMGAICLPFAWRAQAAWIAWGRVAGAVVGIGMVIYLVAQEALVLHKVCLWCTGVHILTFAMFLIVITGWEETGYARSRW